MHYHLKRRISEARGFTLIELLVVIALIGIVAMVSFPRMVEYMAISDFRADARRLVGALKMARMEAVKRNVNCSMAFSTDANGFAIYTVFADDNVNLILDAGETVLFNGIFKNAVIAAAADNGMAANANGDPAVTFNNRGLPFDDTGTPPLADVTVTLSASTDRQKLQRTGVKRNIIYNRMGRIRIQ